MNILVSGICLLASTIGAICGIGGGIIIKPALDLFYPADVTTISFLSGCTVLSMSCYSVMNNLLSQNRQVDLKTGTPLALGSAIGGIVGKQLFSSAKVLFGSSNTVGAVQNACLTLLTIGTLLYILHKSKIKTHQVRGMFRCLLIGVVLGVLSSFLGIGGGPFNLVILFYFFSLETKKAAQNSLYIILFSQVTSLITTFVTKSVPPFEWVTLMLMALGGIGGGMIGRVWNKKLDNTAVDRLFLGLMVIIIGISVYNMFRFL